MAKTQSVATCTAHKLKFDEGAENSQGALAWRATSRNVIIDHCEFEIGLKKAFSSPTGGRASSRPRIRGWAARTSCSRYRQSVLLCSLGSLFSGVLVLGSLFLFCTRHRQSVLLCSLGSLFSFVLVLVSLFSFVLVLGNLFSFVLVLGSLFSSVLVISSLLFSLSTVLGSLFSFVLVIGSLFLCPRYQQSVLICSRSRHPKCVFPSLQALPFDYTGSRRDMDEASASEAWS
jgi:hypothetical protein